MAGDHWKSYSCPLGTRFSAFEGRCTSDPENAVECLSSSEDAEMTELFSDRIVANFECPSVGVFRNHHTATCADYILCVQTMQSSTYAIYLHCEENQFFSDEHSACIDAGIHYCDPDGVLHLINHPTPRPLTAETTSPLRQTTTSPIIESTSVPSTIITTLPPTTTAGTAAPQVEEYKEIATTMPPILATTKRCQDEDNDSDEVELISGPNHPQAIPSSIFRCPGAGRYPSPDSLNLAEYILCTSVYQSKEIQGYLFQCPAKTVFSADMSRCVRENWNLVLTEDITETTTTDRITTESATESVTSTTDIRTTTTAEETSTPVVILDLDTTKEAPDTTTLEMITEAPTTNAAFQCTEQGRFHTERTLNCGSYLLCTRDISGSLIGTYYKCPSDTKFSDVLGRCIRDYECPYYYCVTIGRFPYVRDKDRYVICLENAGRFVAHRMKCPEETIFSNIFRRCISSKVKDLLVWK